MGTHGELGENTLGTTKIQSPRLLKRKKKNCVSWVHAIIPHRLVQISILSCVHHLFWPGFVLFQFCEVCGLMISTWGLSQIWLQVIDESRFCFNPTDTLAIHLSNSLDEVRPRFNFFVAMSQFDWPITQKNWNYGASRKKFRVPAIWPTYLSMKQGSLFCFVSFVLMRSTKPACLDSALGLFGKLSRRRGASAWFHDVWTCGAKVLEYWMISSLKIKLNRSWKFQRNWNVPLILLERSWWAGFNGIYLVRFGFKMWEILI